MIKIVKNERGYVYVENEVEVKEGSFLCTIVCGSRDTYMNHRYHEIEAVAIRGYSKR